MRNFRYDSGRLDGLQRTSDGRLRADVRLTRTGVFRYRNADGSERVEYRPPAEVFAPKSMQSAAMMAVTNDHPPDRLDSTTATRYAKGATGETIRQDGIYLAGSIVVFDADTITAMERGKREVSCGYDCTIIPTPGVTPEGERYDVMQTDIEYNHVAIVDRGRAGSAVRVRMDTAMMIDVTTNEGFKMDELVKALTKIAALEVNLASASAAATAATSRADTAEATAASLTKDIAAADKARKDSVDSFDDCVQERADLLLAATKYLRSDDDKPVAVKGLSNRDIMVRIVKRIDGDDLDASKSADWVAAAYAGAVKRADRGSESLSQVRQAADTTRNDGAKPDDETAAITRMDTDRNSRFTAVKGF